MHDNNGSLKNTEEWKKRDNPLKKELPDSKR